MSLFTSRTHPTFEFLSALSDLDDVHAAASRVGRHVAGCAECLGVLTEIRALGAAARAMPVEDASPALWSRIEVESQAATALPVSAVDGVAGPLSTVASDKTRTRRASPSRRSPVLVVLGTVALAAAAALAAIVIAPNRSSLNATSTSRLTFSPGRPLPGGTLRVRYRPSPWLAGQPRLVLAGHYADPVTRAESPEWRGDLDAFADSLATLLPTADGSYEGTVHLPSDFLAVQLFVADSIGEQRDADGRWAWDAIGGTTRGAPSLDALLAAEDHSWFVFGWSASPRAQQVSVADSIQRYFPGHPAGWAYYQKYGVRSGILDLFRYFQTAERRYASLDAKLWPMKTLDVERLHDMAVLARRIDEPAETRKWTMRLVREHPDDPRALFDLAESLHDVELKAVPQVADSIRPWMPLLDSLRRRRADKRPPWRAIDLVRAYGDSTMQSHWPGRSGMPLGFVYRAAAGRSLDTSASNVALARATASRPCDRPAGRFALTLATSTWQYVCSMRRSATWAYLSAIALMQHRAADALALADSGLQHRERLCGAFAATRARAGALLALGDSATAAREFAIAFGEVPHPSESPDSLATVLGRHLRRAAFDSISRATNQAVSTCDRARVASNLARQRREPR